MTRALVFACFLGGYGNLESLVLGTAMPAGGWVSVMVTAALLGLVLAWARWSERLSPAELGLRPWLSLRSAGLGLLLALGTGLPALLVLRFPPLVGQAVEYTPLGSLSWQALLWRAFVWMPLDTAIPEEVAFRGVLLGSLRHHLTDRRAVLLSSVVFAVWHGVIVSRTVALTNLQAEPLLAALGLVGAYVAVGVGGALFAWLRLATGHLAGSIVAHWAFNALLLLGLGSFSR